MVTEGQKAPDFSLPSSDGGTVRLSDLRGKPVVLYFYPRDLTPGCTREACAFRDLVKGMRGGGAGAGTTADAVVLGVSPDSLASHQKFRAQHKLNFPLLSDVDRAVARKYGAFGEKVMYGKRVTGMIRSTFVIDAAGLVRRAFAKVKVDGHAEEVRAALATL